MVKKQRKFTREFKSAKKRRKFSPEFKAEAVKLAKDTGKGVVAVAKAPLGLSPRQKSRSCRSCGARTASCGWSVSF